MVKSFGTSFGYANGNKGQIASAGNGKMSPAQSKNALGGQGNGMISRNKEISGILANQRQYQENFDTILGKNIFTLYVDNNTGMGSDTNDGSINKPLATLNKALQIIRDELPYNTDYDSDYLFNTYRYTSVGIPAGFQTIPPINYITIKLIASNTAYTITENFEFNHNKAVKIVADLVEYTSVTKPSTFAGDNGTIWSIECDHTVVPTTPWDDDELAGKFLLCDTQDHYSTPLIPIPILSNTTSVNVTTINLAGAIDGTAAGYASLKHLDGGYTIYETAVTINTNGFILNGFINNAPITNNLIIEGCEINQSSIISNADIIKCCVLEAATSVPNVYLCTLYQCAFVPKNSGYLTASRLIGTVLRGYLGGFNPIYIAAQLITHCNIRDGIISSSIEGSPRFESGFNISASLTKFDNCSSYDASSLVSRPGQVMPLIVYCDYCYFKSDLTFMGERVFILDGATFYFRDCILEKDTFKHFVVKGNATVHVGTLTMSAAGTIVDAYTFEVYQGSKLFYINTTAALGTAGAWRINGGATDSATWVVNPSTDFENGVLIQNITPA